MVTETNLTTIKNAIITILKTDTNLWSTQDNHATGFRSIELGLPDNATFEGLAYPVCFVTNHEDLEHAKPFGPITANALGSIEHIYKFKIIFLDQQKNSQEVEQSLDTLYKNIRETLEENNDLNGKVKESFPSRGGSFLAGQLNGKPVDGRVIELVCKLYTA